MSYQLTIDIQSYWHAGTGRGQGSDVDALVHRDQEGIPCLPGRSIKGLLRDAVTRWEQLSGDAGQTNTSLAEQLFGKLPTENAERDADQAPVPFLEGFGLLRISDATLKEADLYHLRKTPELTAGLLRSLHATKINPETGTAEAQSLRGMEVVVPLTLYAEIQEIPGVAPVDDWVNKLEFALKLIHAVGAHRTRGLGRAVLTLEKKR